MRIYGPELAQPHSFNKTRALSSLSLGRLLTVVYFMFHFLFALVLSFSFEVLVSFEVLELDVLVCQAFACVYLRSHTSPGPRGINGRDDVGRGGMMCSGVQMRLGPAICHKLELHLLLELIPNLL